MHFADFWWIILLLMIVVCILMMGGRMRGMMCGHGPNEQEKGHGTGGTETALDILDKRYASGEISKEEYQATKEALTHKGGPS